MRTWGFQTFVTLAAIAVIIPILLLPLVNRVYRRFGAFRLVPAFVTLTTVATACAVIIFTLFPLPVREQLRCRQQPLSDYWQTVPFTAVGDVLAALAEVGFPQILGSPVFLQVAFNLLLFVPVGFVLHRGFGWPAPAVVAGSLGVSLLVEVAQGTALFGLYPCPYRVADVDDLIINTVGGVIGLLASVLLRRRGWLLDPTPITDLTAPGRLRRIAATLLDYLAFTLVGAVLATAVNLIVVAGGGDVDQSWVTAVRWIAQLPIAAILLGLVVPLGRRDLATPGQASVDLAVRATRSRRRTALQRWLVRWLPWVLLPGVGIVALGVIDLVITRRRGDHRSLAGLAAASDTVTLRAQEAGVEDPGAGDPVSSGWSGSA